MDTLSTSRPHIALTVFSSSNAPFECRVRITEEEEGFSIEAVTLPGIVSQGDTVEDAIENFKDAFLGAIEVYAELGKDVPWIRPDEIIEAPEPNTREQWVLINVD